MDSFELNKIAGAVLGTMLVVFGIGTIGDMIFEAEAPEEPAYIIAVAEEAPGAAEATADAAEESIAVLLANADPAAGEAAARKCASCHTFEEGGPNRVGPNLYNVVERPIASVEGFSYSDAMQAHAEEAGDWTFENLNAFIASPRQAVPGTTMGFAGIPSAEERADLLAHLRTLSPDPVPLPEPTEGAAAMAEAEPGEVPEAAEPPLPAAGTAEAESEGEPTAVEPTLDRAGQVEELGEAGPEAAEPQASEQAQPQQQAAENGETILVLPPAGQAGAQAPDGAQQPPQQAEQPQAAQRQGQAAAQPAGDLPPAVALMSGVDAEDGQAEARKCQACHSLEEGGGSRIGPPLWGVVNRPIASIEGFNYSEALTELGQGKEWDFATLDAFIQAPQQLVPGTKMAFPGIRNERDRAELLVYLNSLSAEPAPLPGAQ